MSLLCVGDCGAALENTPQNYHDVCVGDVLRLFGWKQFLLLRCDYQFTDILAPAEWVTARNSGAIAISPEGTLTFNTPNQTTFEIDGCGREKADQAEILIDYSTYQTDITLADFTYFKNLFRQSAGYRIMPVDCNGIFYLSDEFKTAVDAGAPATVAGQSPGFEFGVSQIPLWLAGNNTKYGQWQTQFSLKITDVFCATYLPGVLAALAEPVGT